MVHHGASRASAEELEAEVAGADVVITTYGTAVRDIEALEQHDWDRVVLDEAQAIKNHTNETSQVLRRIGARTRLALTGTPIENGLGDLWSILDFTNPGLVGGRTTFISQLSGEGEQALRALNGILVFRRTKTEPSVAAELPDRIDELDHCTMTAEQIGLYQAVLDGLVVQAGGRRARREAGGDPRRHHGAQADLQPPVELPAGRQAAGRSVGEAQPPRGGRGAGLLRRRADPHLHAVRHLGRAARRAPHRGHRARRSAATTAGSPAAPATR